MGNSSKVPRGLAEFYGGMKKFKGHDGADVREFAPYQRAIWADRFRRHRVRHYIRAPGVGLSRLLLMEALNVVLTSRRRADALVLVADQFEAQRRRNELAEMIEGSEYSEYMVPGGEWTDRMRTHAPYSKAGIVLRSPADASDDQARGISFESVISLSPTSVNMHHVLVLDAMESSFTQGDIRMGMTSAHSTTLLTRGKIVVAVIPRYPYYRLAERVPKINEIEPGELYRREDEIVRRIPMSIAIDAGIIRGNETTQAEMRRMDRSVRNAVYPVDAGEY